MSETDRGFFEQAKDKTKEMAGEVKEKAGEAWDKLTGKTEEQKMADQAKEKIDTCAQKAYEARSKAGDTMRDAARTVEGH